MSVTEPEPLNQAERRAISDVHRDLCETRAANLVAEIGHAMFDLASHPGAIMRLGLHVRFNAGAFEESGDAQRQGFIKILDAVASAKEEARGESGYSAQVSKHRRSRLIRDPRWWLGLCSSFVAGAATVVLLIR